MSQSSEVAAARYGLSGKACLVTGGTKGIGKAVVEEMCALGAKVLFDLCICRRSRYIRVLLLVAPLLCTVLELIV